METLKQISDGSLEDVYLSDFPTAICELDIKQELEDNSEIITNDFDNNEIIENVLDPDVKLESKDPEYKYDSELESKLNSKKKISKKLKCETCSKTFTKLNR